MNKLYLNRHDQYLSYSVESIFRTIPAPLDLCLLEGFGSVSDRRLCPPERTSLSDFYNAAKGPEWTKSTNWMSQYESFCLWHGVICSDTNDTVSLKLPSNGLSGTLSKNIGGLKSISVLDLSDNNIKVCGVE